MSEQILGGKKLEDFDWFLERSQLIRENEARIGRGEFELNKITGQPKKYRYASVDKVLKFAATSMDNPEIWKIYQNIARRYKENPNTEITEQERNVLNYFESWYLLKHAPDYYARPFMTVVRLLLKIAHGWIPSDLSSEEVREFFENEKLVVASEDEEGEKV